MDFPPARAVGEKLAVTSSAMIAATWSEDEAILKADTSQPKVAMQCSPATTLRDDAQALASVAVHVRAASPPGG
jgi:hypothetical protein